MSLIINLFDKICLFSRTYSYNFECIAIYILKLFAELELIGAYFQYLYAAINRWRLILLPGGNFANSQEILPVPEAAW